MGTPSIDHQTSNRSFSDQRPRKGQRPAARLAQIGAKVLSGAAVNKRNSRMTCRISSARSVTPSLRYERLQCVWTVCGEIPRSSAMAKSVLSSNIPRTSCSSRPESLSERPIFAHSCSLKILEPHACHRERSALPTLGRFFIPPHMDYLAEETQIAETNTDQPTV